MTTKWDRGLPGKMMELPRFSLKERDRRWRKIRQAMKAKGLDCLAIWGTNGMWDGWTANVRYVTQIGGNGEQAFVIFPLTGDPTCFTWGPWTMWGCWLAQDWVTDIRPRVPTWAGATAARIKELGFERGNIGVVGLPGLYHQDGWIFYGTYTGLLHELPEANFVNASPLLEEIRMIKSTEEIQFLEKASELGDLMWETMVRTAKPGIKECEVYAKMLEIMISNGGEYPTLLMWGCGPEVPPHPFFLPTSRILQKGDLINVEMHPKYGGYVAHQERTTSLGSPAKEYRDIMKVSIETFGLGLAKMMPGMKIDEWARTVRSYFLQAGLAFVEAGIHGHGLESLEYPTIVFPPGEAAVEVVRPPVTLGKGEFEVGMTVGFMLDLVNSKWKSGNTGLQLADTVLVTETGGRRLGKYKLDLLIIE
jgi:Xaa-Pro dipeptidase